MKPIAEILKAKPGRTIHSISPSASVFDAVKQMADKHIGALLVMDGESIAGIITERDYARKVIVKGKSSKDTPVRDIMSSPVMYVRPDQTNEECMALMTDHRLMCGLLRPSAGTGKVVGLVSIGDLVKDIISEQRFVIEQLQHYIMGDQA